MKFSAITGSNVEGFSYVLLPEVADAIRRGEPVGAIGLIDDEGGIPAAAGAIAGMARNGEFQMISIYVEEKYRLRGFGQLLFDSYSKELERFGLPQSIEFLSTTEEHAGLESFLEKNGFERIDTPEVILRSSLKDIKEREGDAVISEDDGQFVSFDRLPEKVLLHGNEMARLLDLPLPQGGLLSKGIVRECSIGLEKDRELSAYSVVEGLSEREMLLSAIWCRYPVTRIKPLFFRTVRAIKKNYPADSYIYMYVDNDRTGNLLGRSCLAPEVVSRKYSRP